MILVEKLKYGWRCIPCRLGIYGHKDAWTHAEGPPHSIPADMLAEDREGNLRDLRGMDLPRLLRSGGLL